jgi:hypothetical protein
MRFNLEAKPTTQPIPQGVSSPEAVTNFKAATETIDALRAELDAKMEELRNQFREDFSKIAKEFFTAVPRIKSLTWTQYTPYFMDGDPCEFSLNDIEFSTDENPDAEYYREFTDDDGSFAEMSYTLKTLVTPEEFALCQKMESIIHSNADLMEDLFDDHVMVVLTANGAETHEYDHD